jgi:hypothetical protein
MRVPDAEVKDDEPPTERMTVRPAGILVVSEK